MRMAKATDHDFEVMSDFLSGLEQAIERPEFGDEDAANVRGEDVTDEERIGRYVLEKWRAARVCWGRVVFGCEVLVRNVCDPDVSYLRLRPDGREWADRELREIAEETATEARS
jgi:hypothetical protein